jgi:peptidoglycan/LPS O-acetylase OafA/YrhL
MPDAATTSGVTSTGAALPTGFGHKPALDGLRAVAVLSVMAFHFGATAFEGGFLGVDTFFVLSGYLITSLLITEWGRSRTIDLVAFWARRAKRLLPALFLALLLVGIWANLEADPTRLDGIRSDVLWTLFYGANWHFISSGQSYFDLFSEASPLRHAWSLAIEEQFYLFWPLITFAAMKAGKGRTNVLAGVCVAGIAASSAVMVAVYDSDDPSRAYYGTDSRASQLLIGALLAIALTRWSPSTRGQRRGVQVVGLAGAAFMLWAFTSTTDTQSWLYYGGFLLFAVATAAVIVAIVQPKDSPVGWVLSLGPMRWIGLISYGLYLYHWPVVVAISEPRTGLSGWDLALVRIGVTFLIATLSFYLIEMPIRRGALKGSVARVAAPAAFVIVAGVSIVLTSGGQEPPDFLGASPGSVVERGPSPKLAPTVTGAPEGGRLGSVLLLGDSVAASLGDALQLEAATRGIPLATATRPGCGLITGVPTTTEGEAVPWGQGCSDGTAPYLTSQIAERAPQTVLWLSTWETADRLIDGQLYRFGTKEADDVVLERLEESRRLITANGAHLMLLTNPPRAERAETYVRNPEDDRKIERLNGLFEEFAAEHPETVKVVDLAKIVCPRGAPCPEDVGGVTLRPRDGGHYEGDGPGWVAPRLLDAVVRASAATATTP